MGGVKPSSGSFDKIRGKEWGTSSYNGIVGYKRNSLSLSTTFLTNLAKGFLCAAYEARCHIPEKMFCKEM